MNKQYSHFIPRPDTALAQWATTYKDKISPLGLSVGLVAADITTHQDAAQVIIDAVTKVAQKKLELDEAIAAKEMARRNEVQFLAKEAVRIKRHASYTENIGSELGIIGSTIEPVRLTLKPSLKLNVYPNAIEVAFKKKGQPGVTIYTRLKGGEQWEQLGYAATSPYIDNRPLTTAGVAETREFMGRCSNGTIEVGQDSDFVSTVYGG